MNHLSTQNSENIHGGSDLPIRPDPSGGLLVFILLSIVLLVTQCAPLSHKQEMVPNRPESKVLPAKPEVVRTALERVLVQKNYSLNAETSNALHLQTKWLQEGKHRSMLKADLKPVGKSKTEITLHVQLQKKRFLKEEWELIDEVGEDTYRIILGDVEMECYRVLYDGS